MTQLLLKKYASPQRSPHAAKLVLAAGLASVVAYLLAQGARTPVGPEETNAAREASRIMERAETALSRHRPAPASGEALKSDPNRTGLIGLEVDDLTTSVGQLEAKRTTTNPNFAGLVVHLLSEAGVRAGSTVAIGSSGSFPALLIASLAATQALRVHPAVIISLGASTYGATGAEFDLLRIYQLLLEEGVVQVPPIAVSLGGEKDAGLNFEPGLKERLTRQVESCGYPVLYEPDLRNNLKKRLELYARAAGSAGVAAFVNIGGAYANLGTSELVLEMKPGLSRPAGLPPENQRGVLFEMAARGVPVVHLLFIRGLAEKYGLPWDPVPLPRAGDWRIPSEEGEGSWQFRAVAAVYFILLVGLTLAGLHHRRSTTPLKSDRQSPKRQKV